TPDQRAGILSDLSNLVQAGGDLDFDYLSGRRFDPNDPNTSRKIALELDGGIVEILERSTYRDAQISPTLAKYLSWLPLSFLRTLTHLMRKVRSLFGSGYPSAQHFLNPEAASRLQKTIDLLSQKVHNLE